MPSNSIFAKAPTSAPATLVVVPSPWGASPLAPLNIAAFITWLAVGLQSLDGARVRLGDVWQWAGIGAFVLVAVCYVLTNRLDGSDERSRAVQRALVIVQGLAVLLAAWALRSGGPAVLLIIVAAQAVAMWPRHQAILLMAGLNAALVLVWLQGTSLANALLSLLPMLGFQTFAALTIHYATSAERARAALGETHAQLLTTQTLLEESARSGERLRLSRELHDVAGHKLTALKLNLRLLQRDPELAEREEVRVSAQLADELLADIRAVVSELRKYDGIDLTSAIRTLTAQIPGVEFRIDIDPAMRVTRVDSAEILLRCVQEGVTNALRHARAAHIDIGCRAVGERIELTVGNDGAPIRNLAFGNGLNGMRERLSAAGGELWLRERSGGSGTELTAALPIHG
jgi:signal transduction histidine kinase